MSQTTDRQGIDPRFDPRFQRGYVPDAAEPDPAVPSGSSASAGAPTAPTEAPGAHPAGAAATEARDRAEVLELLARAEAERPPSRRVQEPETGSESVALFEPPTPDERSGSTSWYIAGWVLAVVASVVGAALWWSAVASESFYGAPTESERWLQMVGWTVAPSLIEMGLFGCVVMLVWTGVRPAARRGESS